MYRVDYYNVTAGRLLPTGGLPSPKPTVAPTGRPSTLFTNSEYHVSPLSDSGLDVVRYGDVTDLGNGNYTVQLCPVVSGIFEIHILLNSRGVSNQPHTVLSRFHSELQPSGRGQYYGQYVADSPYKLVVSHSTSSGLTSTAEGPGLHSATVGVPASFMVTVRDAYDNVMRTNSPSKALTAVLNRSPGAVVDIWDYQNGSYHVEYLPELAGPNLITVSVDGAQIQGSPFAVPVQDGHTSARYSFAVGQGLHTGRTGDVSYFEVYAFDLDNNRKSDYADTYTFTVNGTSTLSGVLEPCPSPPEPHHPVCDVDDHKAGHYFGYFVPPHTGLITIRVFLKTGPTTEEELQNSPFTALIAPSAPSAELSDVSGTGDAVTCVFCMLAASCLAIAYIAGLVACFNAWLSRLMAPHCNRAVVFLICATIGTLYDNVAGEPATVSLQLRDYFRNKLLTGGRDLELALLGVGGKRSVFHCYRLSTACAD